MSVVRKIGVIASAAATLLVTACSSGAAGAPVGSAPSGPASPSSSSSPQPRTTILHEVLDFHVEKPGNPDELDTDSAVFVEEQHQEEPWNALQAFVAQQDGGPGTLTVTVSDNTPAELTHLRVFYVDTGASIIDSSVVDNQGDVEQIVATSSCPSRGIDEATDIVLEATLDDGSKLVANTQAATLEAADCPVGTFVPVDGGSPESEVLVASARTLYTGR